jgi:hypothetical protein
LEIVEWADEGYMVRVMRAALRLLICLLTSASIAVAVVPTQAAVPQTKAGCCAKMKMDAPANDCGHHAPKSSQEKECCAGCVFCLAILVKTIPLVYPPTGEESFTTVAIREHVRSHRPPVPPPRA